MHICKLELVDGGIESWGGAKIGNARMPAAGSLVPVLMFLSLNYNLHGDAKCRQSKSSLGTSLGIILGT